MYHTLDKDGQCKKIGGYGGDAIASYNVYFILYRAYVVYSLTL